MITKWLFPISITFFLLIVEGKSQAQIISDSLSAKNSNTDKNAGVNLDAQRFYYNKYFDLLVDQSLQKGFYTSTPIGDQDYYGVLKCAAKLAEYGDSTVVIKMIDFLDTLETKFDNKSPISVFHAELFYFYYWMPRNELFPIGMRYMEDYKNDAGQATSVSEFYENPSMIIFTEYFLLKMAQPESEKYINLILHEFKKTGPKYDGNMAMWYIWDEVFPIIKEDWINNRIHFKE